MRRWIPRIAAGYDPDAQAYFDAVVAAGSTIGTTAKDAVNAFVVGCKADSIWTLLLDVGPLAGDDLTGALVKLKSLGGTAYTNTNFVSGDYSQATGLAGNGINKRLSAGFNCNTLTSNSTGLGVYDRTTANGTQSLHGSYVNATNGFYLYATYTDDIPYSGQYDEANSIGGSALTGSPIGFIFATRPSSGSHVLYRNGSSVGSSGTTGGTLPNQICQFFAANGLDHTTHVLAFLVVTSGMDGTQAAALNTRVQALQTALGRNV